MAPRSAHVHALKPMHLRPMALAPLPSRPAVPPRGSLHERAVAADAASSIDINLALLWRELMNGLFQVVDDFFSDERCYLLLSPTSGGPEHPVEGRRRRILEAMLCGQGQKSIAIDLGLAPSTIALNARLALESLGLCCKPSRVHPLLMLAATAASEKGSTLAATLSFIQEGDTQLRVVSMPRPDRRLSALLPPAELAVVGSLIEGEAYERIAHRRGTSTRTIANQITAVFRRLRVSGRNELLHRLFAAEGVGRGPLPSPRTSTVVPSGAASAASLGRRSA